MHGEVASKEERPVIKWLGVPCSRAWSR